MPDPIYLNYLYNKLTLLDDTLIKDYFYHPTTVKTLTDQISLFQKRSKNYTGLSQALNKLLPIAEDADNTVYWECILQLIDGKVSILDYGEKILSIAEHVPIEFASALAYKILTQWKNDPDTQKRIAAYEKFSIIIHKYDLESDQEILKHVVELGQTKIADVKISEEELKQILFILKIHINFTGLEKIKSMLCDLSLKRLALKKDNLQEMILDFITTLDFTYSNETLPVFTLMKNKIQEFLNSGVVDNIIRAKKLISRYNRETNSPDQDIGIIISVKLLEVRQEGSVNKFKFGDPDYRLAILDFITWNFAMFNSKIQQNTKNLLIITLSALFGRNVTPEDLPENLVSKVLEALKLLLPTIQQQSDDIKTKISKDIVNYYKYVHGYEAHKLGTDLIENLEAFISESEYLDALGAVLNDAPNLLITHAETLMNRGFKGRLIVRRLAAKLIDSGSNEKDKILKVIENCYRSINSDDDYVNDFIVLLTGNTDSAINQIDSVLLKSLKYSKVDTGLVESKIGQKAMEENNLINKKRLILLHARIKKGESPRIYEVLEQCITSTEPNRVLLVIDVLNDSIAFGRLSKKNRDRIFDKLAEIYPRQVQDTQQKLLKLVQDAKALTDSRKTAMGIK